MLKNSTIAYLFLSFRAGEFKIRALSDMKCGGVSLVDLYPYMTERESSSPYLPLKGH
jgi:hypothetical protein